MPKTMKRSKTNSDSGSQKLRNSVSSSSSNKSDKRQSSSGQSKRHLRESNKYEGIEVDPNACLFNFDFKKKKGSGSSASSVSINLDGPRMTRGSSSSSPAKQASNGHRSDSSRKKPDSQSPKKSAPRGPKAKTSKRKSSSSDADANGIFEDTNLKKAPSVSTETVNSVHDDRVVKGKNVIEKLASKLAVKAGSTGPKRRKPSGDNAGDSESGNGNQKSNTEVHEERQLTSTHAVRNLEELIDENSSSQQLSSMSANVNSSEVGPATTTEKKAPVICQIDSNLEQYRELQNACEFDYIKVDLECKGPEYIQPSNLEWVQICPGVTMAVTWQSNNFKTGYIRVGPKTVKPIGRALDGITCLGLIEGHITCKSSNFAFRDDGSPYLMSVELAEGSYITIPRGAIYSLENWSDEESALHFAISQVETA